MNPHTYALAARQATTYLSSYYEKSGEIEQSILRHSGIAGAIVLLPIPVVGEIACIVNQIHMYQQINKLLGIKFSKNFLKCIGNFLLSQVTGAAALFVGIGILKFIPGINFASGFIQAPLGTAINYTCGKVYYAMLKDYLSCDISENTSESEKLAILKGFVPSQDAIKGIYGNAKNSVKGIKFADYKAEAEACASEAKGENR